MTTGRINQVATRFFTSEESRSRNSCTRSVATLCPSALQGSFAVQTVSDYTEDRHDANSQELRPFPAFPPSSVPAPVGPTPYVTDLIPPRSSPQNHRRSSRQWTPVPTRGPYPRCGGGLRRTVRLVKSLDPSDLILGTVLPPDCIPDTREPLGRAASKLSVTNEVQG